MRLWSISPEYLDTKGLVACWREALLAKNVLMGNTKGYKNHPQLTRFKKTSDPILYINTYLFFIYDEAMNRNYNFDISKIGDYDVSISIDVQMGQIQYEFDHLMNKLRFRDHNRFQKVIKEKNNIKINPLFKIISGDIEEWEKVI